MGEDTTARDRRRDAGLFLAIALLCVYPPLYVALRGGSRGLCAMVGGDALLYLTIARNSTGTFFTYDGTTPTNGFHPLWQFFLSAVIPRDTPIGGMTPVWIAFTCSLIAVAVGSGLAALAISRYTTSRWLGLLTVPGVYYAVCGSMFGNNPVWANVSGMEAGFSTLFGGAFLYVLARAVTDPRAPLDQSPYRVPGLLSPWLRMGLVLPFMVLSRLDDVFILPGLVLVVWAFDRDRAHNRQKIVAVAQLVGPTFIAILVYMVFNKAYAGTALPISGQTKSGFALGKNIYVLLAGVFPPLVDFKNAVSTRQSVPAVLFANGFRWAELLVPALIAAAYTRWYLSLHSGRGASSSASPRPTPTSRTSGASLESGPSLRYALPVGLALGVILKALYNLANVNFWHQAGWYFALALVTASFFSAILLKPVADLLAKTPVLKRVIPFAYLLYILIAASRSIGATEAFGLQNVEYDFIADRQQITEKLRASGNTVKLLAFDDGATGYALPFPTMHGFVFAGDLDSSRALRNEHLLRHAYNRGHDILTSAIYFPVTTPLTSSDDIREFLRGSILEDRVKAELDQFDFQLIYVHQITHAPFFKFGPRKQVQQ